MEIGNRDLDKVDPDWRFAYFHAKATRPGICTDERPELCECCLNIIHKDPVDVGVHTKELEFLGFGFPLWFSFLKYCIILTIILIVSEASVSVFQAVHMNKQFCKKEYNQLSKWTGHSDQQKPISTHEHNFDHLMTINQSSHHAGLLRRYSHNSEHPSETTTEQSNSAKAKSTKERKAIGDSLLEKKPKPQQDQEEGHVEGEHHHCTGIFILLSRIDADIDQLEAMLRVSTFIIIMFTLLFIRDTIYKTEQYYDERMCSLSDYSILVSKLPQADGVQTMLRNFFKQGLDQPFHMEELILMPGLEELQEAQHEKNHHIKQLQKLYKSGKQDHAGEIAQIQHEIEEVEEIEEKALEDFKHGLRSDKLHAEKAIVVLSSEPEKEKFLEQFDNLKQEDPGKLVQFFGMQGAQVEFTEAPQPREIIWENINYPTSKRFGRVLLGWSLSILFIAVITGVFYFILKWKTHVAEEVSLKYATIIVFVALILVILFNKFVMGHVLHYFTHLQKHATADNEQLSFAFKYALGMFFTTALMTLFVEAITYGNFYTHHYGVIEQESIMFFMNSLLVPIIWAINPFQIFVLIRRKMNFGKKYLTQREANHIMEDFNYDVGKRYAEVLESMWFTFLYAPLIPFGAFLTAIGIGLYYWVDKYNLLRRSSIKENVSGKLSITALTLLDLVLVFFALGQIIFDHFLRHHVNLSSIIQLIVSIVYICLPLNSLIDFFNKENFYLQEKQYRDVKDTFKDNYMDLHPMYSKLNADQNTESRRLYKESVMKQLANPVFSFISGWMGNKNQHNTLFGRHLSSKMKTTCDESSLRPESYPFSK